MMQAQATICPICIDDHQPDRPCKYKDLLDRIVYLSGKVDETKRRNMVSIETDMGPCDFIPLAQANAELEEAEWLIGSMLVAPAVGTVPGDWKERLLRWRYARAAATEEKETEAESNVGAVWTGGEHQG